MARACKALASELVFFSDGAPRPVVILTGAGNNGGDGFGVALHLHQLGWPVWVWSAVPRERIQGDALDMLEQAEAGGVRVSWKPGEKEWEGLASWIPPGAWLVDALLGTGVESAPRGTVAAAIAVLGQAAITHRIWAVDLPSGLNPDVGIPFDPDLCVTADTTLTLGAPKTGLAMDVSVKWAGAVTVLDIGLNWGTESDGNEWQVLTDREVREAFPSAQADAHKGTLGHSFLMGGSVGMSGAIGMCAMGALRSGCGLATVLAPRETALEMDPSFPEVMMIPGVQSRFNTLAPQNIDFDPYSVCAIGPGLRMDPETIELLHRVMAENPHPLVVDADGLRCLAKAHIGWEQAKRELFLTPHPGEMAKLLDLTKDEVQDDREGAVTQAAEKFGAWTVLKGSRSRMTGPDGKRWVNLTGNSALATAGSGDVLTGILTGLISRGVMSGIAIPVAVYLHGRAGELASIRRGKSAVTAGDVLDALPAVMMQAEGR